MTDEMRRKKSEIMKGRVSGHKGHKHTDETKKKMSEAKKGKKSPACKIIVKCDMDGNIITEFPSVKSAILDSNKSQRFFYKRLKMQEPINGFIYKYKEQEQQDSENIIQE